MGVVVFCFFCVCLVSVIALVLFCVFSHVFCEYPSVSSVFAFAFASALVFLLFLLLCFCERPCGFWCLLFCCCAHPWVLVCLLLFLRGPFCFWGFSFSALSLFVRSSRCSPSLLSVGRCLGNSWLLFIRPWAAKADNSICTKFPRSSVVLAFRPWACVC